MIVFARHSTGLIRPTEGTMVERLAPRIAVRRGAELKLPHILVLIDDPACSVIEPLAAARGALTELYRTELMEGGGSVAGFGIERSRVDAAFPDSVQRRGRLQGYPAYCTGVCGLRPSFGRVPAYLDSAKEERAISMAMMSVQGPLARRAAHR